MRIVIIEDEAPIREGIAKLLNKINPDYELAGTAADGLEGYELIRNTHPDLIILDIEMPRMNGLKMLEKLRRENNHCKVLVLSAYSDFNYARQAIELNIENYLLKPIKIPELKRALQQIEENLEKERRQEQTFTAEGIFLACLNGQIQPDEQFDKMTKERHGFTVEEPAEVFGLWLGDGYERQKKVARELLQDIENHAVKFASCVIEADTWNMLIMVLYRLSQGESQHEYFRHSVVPMLCSKLESPVVCIWKDMESIIELPRVMQEMQKERVWNLMLKKGDLIRKEEVETIYTMPLKQPTDLEDKACQAVRRKDIRTVQECFADLLTYYKKAPYEPAKMKQSIIHFSWAVINAFMETEQIEADLQVQNILQEILEAVSWHQINISLKKLLRIIGSRNREEEMLPVSDLVQKARHLIRKYYDQGITLEEIADKLFVSEEYLSTQFKKETGTTFSETIKKCRIDKVKELLRDTHLKLNQIADLAGYSDPKYMSRVFKEEVGMLPNEFRKSVH